MRSTRVPAARFSPAAARLRPTGRALAGASMVSSTRSEKSATTILIVDLEFLLAKRGRASRQTSNAAAARFSWSRSHSPIRWAAWAAMAPTAAINRGSLSRIHSIRPTEVMRVWSAGFLFGETDVASLATIRAIIQPVDAQAHVIRGLAEAAVLVAGALRLRFVALRADRGHN